MSEHQTDWRQVKIGELLTEHSERSISNNQHEVLSVTKDGIFSQREYFKKQIASEDNSGYKLVRRGDVVFSAMNLWMGSIDVVKDQEIGIVSPAYITMQPNQGLVDTDFLGYFLRGVEMRKKYVQHSQQGASIVRRNLNKDDLLDDEIEIPPLPEQKKIAEILSGIDNRIGTAENQAQYYSVLLDSISHDSFSRKAIETVTLGEIAEFKSGRAFKSEELSEDGMKVTRISNLHKPYFPYWRYNGEYNPSIISRDGDILFSWAGVANSINVHRYKGEDTLLNQHIYNFDFCDPLLKEWTYWTLKNMLPKLRASIEGGAGQLHLTKGFIQSLPIPIFESRRMESLCKCFQSLENLENKQKILSTRLGALKNALSCDLLSGRKRVSV